VSGYRDFYATLAQVLPVLLLTIVWDRHWLDGLPARTRGTGPGEVRFWTKPVVRWYSLFLTAALVLAIGGCLLVLVGAADDATWLRVLLMAAAGLSLVTLLVRVSSGIVTATKSP
jgi:hypothetical protein